MIRKRETCLYCGEKMESVTAKKKFCSAVHKNYWHRENTKPQKQYYKPPPKQLKVNESERLFWLVKKEEK